MNTAHKHTFINRPKKVDPKLYHLLTSPFRYVPDFLIIGTQRGGTTSLFNYLAQHPQIIPSRRKEIHFFDYQFNKGFSWYKAYFPLKLFKSKKLAMEASPSYIFHPHTPKRIKSILPDIKFILLLRNPIDRAYSQYLLAYANKVEQRPFSEVIRTEDTWFHIEHKKILADENYYSYDHHRRSFLNRGKYIIQIKNWLKWFSREQILILISEDFFNNPLRTLSQICMFLEIDNISFDITKKLNKTLFLKPMNKNDRLFLQKYYKPFNEELYEFLGKDLSWK